MSSFKNAVTELVQNLKFYEINKVLICTKAKFLMLRFILKIFIKYGILYSYKITSDNKLLLSVNYSKYFHIKYYSKIKYLSIYNLKSLVNKFPGNIYILSTSIGIIDSTTAIQKNIGGRLLFILKTKNSLAKGVK